MNRREFLKSAAALSALSALPPGLRALAADDILTAYTSALATPFAAPLNIPFERVVGADNIALVLYDLDNARLLAALQPENPLPVASAFKAPMLMHFLHTVDPAVWRGVPVADWPGHSSILGALYRALVFSDNPATGEVLSYTAAQINRTDPIVAFNDWSHEVAGTSQLSGLSAWGQGVSAGMTVSDPRYTGRGTTINGQIVPLGNMMTARDLGLFYAWMLTDMRDDARETALSLLSVIHDNRGANLERLATERGGTPYSKNGSLGTDAGYVVADAGLLDIERGRFLLVVLSLNAPATVPVLFEELGGALDGRYNEWIHNRHYAGISDEELYRDYTAHLRANYRQQRDDATVRYGFIRRANVPVFRHPREDAPLHNPVIKSTRFGIHLLMQGALLRYIDVGRGWVQLVPDNDQDNVRSRLGTEVFVKKADVWPISTGYAAPLPFLVDDTIQHTDKFIVVLLAQRELVAFEAGTPVMRMPIVLNPDATPRGAQVITSKWLARSMQPWAPGVPFTSFFGGEGYALHGSPWQRWSTTVTADTIHGRSSAGCINIPDWSVTCGDHTRPADELLFRWIGGIEDPHANVFEYPSDTFPALRIYNVDYAEHLRSYYLPEGLSRHGLSWEDVLPRLQEMPLQAPPSFFV